MPLPPADGAGLDLSLPDTNRAILNILEDFAGERTWHGDTQKAILNILDDFGDEKQRLEETQRAVLNILDDSGEERTRQGTMHQALLNILDDFGDEKRRLEREFLVRSAHGPVARMLEISGLGQWLAGETT